MINPLWLRTFCTLVEVGHFTKTAEKLYMTQSGVSQHIKKLEKQLESQLLLREGKSFSLSSKGRELYKNGYELLRASTELEALIKEDEPYSGLIRIASPGSIGLSLYPHLLNLQQTHSGLSIDYQFAPNKRIEQQLEDNHIDLGLITELSKRHNIRVEKIAEEPLVVVTPSHVTSVNWQTLIKLGFIGHPDASHHCNQLLCANFPLFEHIDQFTSHGFSNQISLILTPVSKGLGFTVLPINAAQAYQPQHLINIHRLANPVSESVYLCMNRRAIVSAKKTLFRAKIITYLA